MKKRTILIVLFAAAKHTFSWSWVSPYAVKAMNFENATNQIQFTVSNPTNPSDPNLGYTFIYDCDQPGNSWEGGKVIQSILLTSIATGQSMGFETQNFSGSTVNWEIRQIKIIRK